jgi:hypothetical protein
VGVNDGLDVRAHLIDQQMHADFAGDGAAAGDEVAIEVDDDHVFGAHGAFADTSRCHQNSVAVEADGEISIHGCNESPVVQHASVTDDIFPVFAFGRHEYPWGGVLPEAGQHFGNRIVPAPLGRNNPIFGNGADLAGAQGRWGAGVGLARDVGRDRDPFGKLRAGSSLRLKSGFAQDDTNRWWLIQPSRLGIRNGNL